MVTNTGGAQEDVKVWIQTSNAVFIKVNEVWKAREIPIATKLRVVRSNVKPVLGYEM